MQLGEGCKTSIFPGKKGRESHEITNLQALQNTTRSKTYTCTILFQIQMRVDSHNFAFTDPDTDQFKEIATVPIQINLFEHKIRQGGLTYLS